MGEPFSDAAGAPAPCGAAQCHHERGGQSQVRWWRRVPCRTLVLGTFRCAAPSWPGFRLAGLGSRGASGCICPRKTPATRLRCAAREPRSPLCGHAGKATIIVLSRSARPCDAPYTRGLLDPYHVLCGETEAQSQFPKATHGELEFEPELPNSGAQGLTPHLAGRLWAPPFPISHLLSLCHLTFLLPLGWGSQFAAGDC